MNVQELGDYARGFVGCSEDVGAVGDTLFNMRFGVPHPDAQPDEPAGPRAVVKFDLPGPMHQVFDQIAMDAVEFIDSSAEAIGMAIDATRIDMLGGDREADDLIRELVDEHGYDAVLRFLSRHVKLYCTPCAGRHGC